MNHLVIAPATLAAYDAFAHLHYRGGTPRAVDRVLVATLDDQPAGILVAARPVLNASWRTSAWPDGPWSRRTDAATFVNRHVRRIARVVVDPRVRGLGVGAALVRDYLASPCTPRTEVVASMARSSPLFTRCGMREVHIDEPARHRTLRRDLAALGIAPWELIDVTAARRLLEGQPAFRRVIERWASGSRHSRHALTHLDLLERAAVQAASLVSWPARAFVYP
jgi:hypothetical protein